MTAIKNFPVIDRALNDLAALAHLPENEGALSQARHRLNQINEHLNLLDDLRYSARGIIDLYNQVPVLEAIDIDLVIHNHGDDGKECWFYFKDAKVLEGRLDPDVNIESFQDALKHALQSEMLLEPEDEVLAGVEKKTELFDSDVVCLYTAANGAGFARSGHAVTLKTSRAQIMDALDEGSIDTVAAALFPANWRYVAKFFDMPLYSAEEPTHQARQRMQ